MHLLKSCLLPFAGLLAGVLTLSAQSPSSAPAKARPRGRASPHETTSAVLAGGERVVLIYGRPYAKDPKTGEERKIWGNLVGGKANPWDQPWRMGADEATVLLTTAALKFGDLTLPAGAYSLYMLPRETGNSQLIFNRKVGQWGIAGETRSGDTMVNLTYPDSMKATEVGRVDLTKDELPSNVEELTLRVARTSDGGVLQLDWEKTRFSVPFTLVK
ncbi:MAG TPA: DUF2911 domain-containing protein [Opitutaceae bacterium]|nr:DUF2911 domain-containing protein [Opitutaceae bacterium]